jgi:hypothetical protein
MMPTKTSAGPIRGGASWVFASGPLLSACFIDIAHIGHWAYLSAKRANGVWPLKRAVGLGGRRRRLRPGRQHALGSPGFGVRLAVPAPRTTRDVCAWRGNTAMPPPPGCAPRLSVMSWCLGRLACQSCFGARAAPCPPPHARRPAFKEACGSAVSRPRRTPLSSLRTQSRPSPPSL